MNTERALISRAIVTGGTPTLISRGIAQHHFSQNTPDGQELSAVYGWLCDFARKHNSAPSQELFRQRWNDFRYEPTSDPLEALIDAFFAQVKRRVFSAKVTELAKAEADPSRWHELDVVMMDAARDLCALVPSGHVSRLSEMTQRVDRYEEEVANPDLVRGFSTGIDSFDDLTNGMRPGNVVTVAGASSRGKSLLSQWILMNAHEQDAMGLLMSLEMTGEEIFERLDTMVVHFSHKLLAHHDLPPEQIDLWRRLAKQFSGLKHDIVVKDRMLGATTDHVYAEISRYKPDVAVVDYVQLMKSRQRYSSQWEALTDTTNELKQIALATDCAIVMVSQDGRDSFQNGSTEENMGNSISVYQAADLYLGLHQTDEMYATNSMEVRLLKNRRGMKKQTAQLLWRPGDMTFEYQPPGSNHQTYLRAVPDAA